VQVIAARFDDSVDRMGECADRIEKTGDELKGTNLALAGAIERFNAFIEAQDKRAIEFMSTVNSRLSEGANRFDAIEGRLSSAEARLASATVQDQQVVKGASTGWASTWASIIAAALAIFAQYIWSKLGGGPPVP
jgi:hypothetical protein